MIKLFSLKQQKKEGEGAKAGTKRASAAQLRIQKGAAWCGVFLEKELKLTELCCHCIIDLSHFRALGSVK